MPLTGRKTEIHLGPVLWEECSDSFEVTDIDHRLLHGGLPEALLAGRKDPDFYSEWLDSFYARDIQELFSIRNRQGFLTLFRALLRQSGGQVHYTSLASISEVTRPTIKTYLDVLQVAHAIHLLRPFSGGGKREIISRPKCYALDTGFVTYERGWDTLRPTDRGVLWEHLVLDAPRFRFSDDSLFYWQDKLGREVDFVIRRNRDRVDLVECKLNPGKVSAGGIAQFRSSYPEGSNYLVSPLIESPYQTRVGDHVFTVCRPRDIPSSAPQEPYSNPS